MNRILLFSLFLVSCRSGHTPAVSLASANLSALEQTVDMENHRVETDAVLEFEQPVVGLGEVPLGESREVTLTATNRSDKPLVLLDAYTSCQCTRVAWDRRPIPAGGKTTFRVRFTAEQPGTFYKKVAVRHHAGPQPVTFALEGVVTERKADNK